jgi:hypothetical protein
MGLFEKFTAEEDGGGGSVSGDFVLENKAKVVANELWLEDSNREIMEGERENCQFVIMNKF